MLPLVAPETRMSDALLTMTAKRFGCVGIVDGDGLLLGIVTDGDLRRHMSTALLDRSAAEVMTANYIGNPDTITAGQTLLIPKAPADEQSEQPQIKRIGPERNGYLYYTVQTGDTLSQLATDFDSTLLALLDYNSLPNAETVYRGLELRIPFGSPPLPVQLPPTPSSGTTSSCPHPRSSGAGGGS